MKRDMDLVRSILLAIEDCEHGSISGNPTIAGFTVEEVGYHAYLMQQAGLVTGYDSGSIGSKSPEWEVSGMTWKGHEFLEASREPGRWKEAKDVMRKAGGGSFDVWLSVLASLVTKNLSI